MEIQISYAVDQLETAVKFIARNNSHFLGQTDYIREEIIQSMRRMALDPDGYMTGTMGFLLIADREMEGIDCDQNVARIEIYVDPSLGLDHMDGEYVEELLNG